MGCDNADVARLRQDFERFVSGDEKVHTFRLVSAPGTLIRDIYAVIFPGPRLPLFYLRFAIARLAQAVDLPALKTPLYRLIGVRIGRGVFISADVIIDPHFPELIEIGDHAIIGWGAKLFTHEWFAGTYRAGRITIGPGAMIGAFAVVRGGVTIGANADIGAMSVVVRDVPPGGRLVDRQLLRDAAAETKRPTHS
jgi:acetyltransferase-like isoleucine patch superfamily enzyme